MEQKNELSITEEFNGPVYILHLQGDLTKTSGEVILKWKPWANGLGEGVHALLLDFSQVEYMNSAGLAALIRLARVSSQEAGFRTGCYGLTYHYEKLFGMVGLTKYLNIYPSEWAALDHMQTK